MSRINLNEIEDYLDDEYGYESFERIKSDKPRENSKSDIYSEEKRRYVKLKRVQKEQQLNY